MTKKPDLGLLEEVDLRDHWSREDIDFTPWLAQEQNIALLGKTIGVDLEVLSEEARVGPFRADILCSNTASDEKVIVENQLEKTDHTHLGQTLVYAAGLKAVTVVWIAKTFTEEHRATLDWLNEVTNKDIRFFGLEIQLWRIGDSKPAPRFNIVAKPNDWSKMRHDPATAGPLTAGQQAQIEFWTGFGEYLTEQKASFRPPKPYPSNWTTWGIGKGGTGMLVRVNAAEVIIGLEIDKRTHPTWYDKLEANAGDIHAELGFELVWEPKPGNKYSFALAKKTVDTRSKTKRPVAFKWLLERMVKIDSVFRPRVKALDDSGIEGMKTLLLFPGGLMQQCLFQLLALCDVLEGQHRHAALQDGHGGNGQTGDQQFRVPALQADLFQPPNGGLCESRLDGREHASGSIGGPIRQQRGQGMAHQRFLVPLQQVLRLGVGIDDPELRVEHDQPFQHGFQHGIEKCLILPQSRHGPGQVGSVLAGRRFQQGPA